MNTYALEQLSKIPPADLEAGLQNSRQVSALNYLSFAAGNSQDLICRSFLFQLTRLYGPNVEKLAQQIQRIAALATQFTESYGEGPVVLLHAPARINILGEHVDYVSYLPTQSLPFGSREHDMLMLLRRSDTDRVRGISTDVEYPPFSFDLNEGPPILPRVDVDADWLSYLFEHPAEAPHWNNYVKGPAYLSRIQFGDKLKRGFDFVVDSGIPAGGGASSSSSLVVLANAACRLVNGIEWTPIELARDSAKAEWYVGTRGGAMDHITICLAKRDHAVLISYPNQQAQQVDLPGQDFRWVTFFSKAADKGREVMIEYNERAVISRIVLPALIDGWKKTRPANYERWQAAVQSIDGTGALDEVESLLNQLPDCLTLKEIRRDYPDAFAECARAFPVLIAERSDSPLTVRDRALHHLGEIRRVSTATKVLAGLSQLTSRTGSADQETDAAMRVLGSLLDQSHDSLRDLYQVSTPEVERLTEIIRTTPGVYGARLMGGGFGGNVLALTRSENVDSLVKRTQAEYYGPQDRQGVSEGSVMISTPGDGLAQIDYEEVWREAIDALNSLQHNAEQYRNSINNLLDLVPIDDAEVMVWPIIVAAGKGTRSLASGLTTPKPLAPLLGIPSIIHVIKNTRAAFGATPAPIVIVSPETESATRACLKDEVTFVVQPEALGTGDAVLRTHEQLKGFAGRTLVIWGTQPVVRPATMRRTLKLAVLFAAYDMVLPTAYKERPYAPVLRDGNGRVEAASETHLEQADQLPFGESNVGMFLLKNQAMFEALFDLRRKYWNESQQRYNRHGGELGFPNELINYFAARDRGVFACPIADSREEQGIKRLADIEPCERFISELAMLNPESNL